MESGKYTQVGNWWDRKGENELDIVAINEFDMTGMVAEVKRNPKKISISKIKDKINHGSPEIFIARNRGFPKIFASVFYK